jgi:prenyltransferase beta subunit
MATAIDWFNIKTGETVYTSRPAQIKGLIESSDLGVNRQSDVGWRLGKEWVAKLRKARNNREMMANLGKMSGGDVTDTQLLVAIFSIEATATHTNMPTSDLARSSIGSFLSSHFDDGVATLVDPYAEAGLAHGLPTP